MTMPLGAAHGGWSRKDRSGSSASDCIKHRHTRATIVSLIQ